MNKLVDNKIKGSWKEKHKLVIEEVLHVINNNSSNYILKGGTALMECYGLKRFSEDIDLDSSDKKTIFKILFSYCKSKNYDYRIAKQIDTVSRIMIDYNGQKPLKVEVSHRKNHINENEFCELNGINVYKLDTLANLKAVAYSSRDDIRDLYDICFLINEKYSELSAESINYIRNTVEYKGIDQFDYITREQKDDLIDNKKLANDFLTMFEKLDLFTPLRRKNDNINI
ncbi:MAG: nucleotidyl transferase AbiEii/AbiGii toxin family protein [Lachnospiraceae bacterium]|nr:nucleotidyl transferase AbiEii/AbiGii toxin family protein [Lachnospiraceae bacterium]